MVAIGCQVCTGELNMDDAEVVCEEHLNCTHDRIGRDPADWSVGIFTDHVWCEVCGKTLNPDDFESDEYDG